MPYKSQFDRSDTSIAWPLAWVTLIFSAIYIFISLDNITSRAGWGPDDQLRMVQLRDFLNGQSWFDWTQYRMNTPDGAPMHWSRLIELPLALLILILSPIFGQNIAEMIAGTLIPLSGLALTSYMIGRICLTLWNKQAAIFAIILTWFNPAISFQFRPMRIDHHGWQIALATLALWTMFWPSKKWGGIILGAALATWLHISLEGLPLTAAFFVILGWRWIIKKAHGQRLIWTIISFTISSFFLYFATQGLTSSILVYCDSISAPHLAAITSAAIIMLIALNSTPKRRWMRLIAASVAGGSALAILVTLAPQCTGGAFAQLDPLVHDYWYINIREGLPIWDQLLQGVIMVIALPVIAVIALVLFVPKFANNIRIRLYLLGFFIIYSTLLSLLVFRTITVASAYAIPLVAILLAEIWSRYKRSPNSIQRIMLIVSIFIIAMAGPLLNSITRIVIPQQESEEEQIITSTKPPIVCASPKGLEELKQIKAPANIIAPFNLSPLILLSSDHYVLASSHHRNHMAMRDQIAAMIGSSDEANIIIKARNITHIVMCKDDEEWGNYINKHPDSFAASLIEGTHPKWLVKNPTKGHLLIWQVAIRP